MAEASRTPFQADDRGTYVPVIVVPNASRSEVVGALGDAIKVRVAVPAEKGKANEAVLRLLSARCDAVVELVRGGTSRRKVVLVVGKTPREVEACLGSTRAG